MKEKTILKNLKKIIEKKIEQKLKYDVLEAVYNTNEKENSKKIMIKRFPTRY